MITYRMTIEFESESKDELWAIVHKYSQLIVDHEMLELEDNDEDDDYEGYL